MLPNSLQYKPSKIESAILGVLCYFKLFDHPLKKAEIFCFSQEKVRAFAEFEAALTHLVELGVIHLTGKYYFLEEEMEVFIDSREEAYCNAQKSLKLAQKIARFIHCFPFVRAVFISGSLSKMSFPEGADFDFFIVTKTDRLWVSKMILAAFKRVFLFNSKRYFCINYFVDEEHLEIPDRNVFTATEICTLLPVVGKGVYSELLKANSWVYDYFPNYKEKEWAVSDRSLFKRIGDFFEWPLSGKLGNKLDLYFMDVTYARWRKMYLDEMPSDQFDLAFRTTRGISKNHFKNYQFKVLKKYSDQVNKTEKVYQENYAKNISR
ncbi:hypothetical protein LAG90_01285 [Marinilongibacter aquaticus]|uniref:hypothetical protein n=1 Tax=Marinilongibacter aquaticus TaxID=2975157 RepID=UPI0021BDB5E8|nr:hypothetical protein [Marinilongibacter aquaticus]UBM59289.1 hypothetical protein LAG90_01285 [Marinilongibacter aquaticus]